MTTRPRLLVVSQFWSPAMFAGGARSTERAVATVADDADVWVVAGDRDVGDAHAWSDVVAGRWIDRPGWRVQYGPWGRASLRRVRDAARHVQPDVVYLPSLFAPGSLAALTLDRVGRLPGRRIVAVEGELDPGALARHPWRKRVALGALRGTGARRGGVWRAADADEAARIHDVIGAEADVVIAPDLVGPPPVADAAPSGPPKQPGRARITFLSSIVPKKGLPDLVEVLRPFGDAVELRVYGPATDSREWGRSERALRDSGLDWRYRGPIDHDEVPATLAASDLLVLPTRGENYGYVIGEALDAGCPVLTSDRTPWSDLADAGCGWTLALDDRAAWRAAVAEVVAWDEAERERVRVAARARGARERDQAPAAIDAWRDLLLPS